MAMHRLNRRWTRWLASQGIPSGHIARVLDVDQADVDEVLRWRWKSRSITIEQEDTIRRLAADGRTAREIGAELGMPRTTVADILGRSPISRPALPPRGRGRSLRGETATKVRRLTELGYQPVNIAAILDIRKSDVIDFLARSAPIRRPKNGTEDLVRPRGRAEHKRAMATLRRRERRRRPPAEPDGWGYRDQSPVEVLGVEPAAAEVLGATLEPPIVAAEVPELVAEARVDDQAAAELPATSADDWKQCGPRGEHSPRSMLTFELAEEIRAEWASGGIGQRALALKWCISVATLKRVLARRSYAEPPAEPSPVETMPATSAPRRPRKPRARARTCRSWPYRDVGDA